MPTKRSETARLQRSRIDNERIDGVLKMAASTTALPNIEKIINGTFKAQLMMTVISG